MGVHSGKFGVVNGHTAIRNWQISQVSTPTKYVASNTHGGPGRKRGIKSWTGSFAGYGGAPAVMPGELFTFQGYTAPSNGVEGSVGDTYSGSAIVDSVAVNWNWESGDIIGYTVNFSGHEAVTRGSNVWEDLELPEVHEAIDVAFQLEGSSTICNLTSATLNVLAENKAFVNSCTDGWTGRRPGPIDANLSVTLQDTNPDEFVAGIGDDLELRLYVSADTWWAVKWLHFKEISSLNVDRETGNIITFTANFDFNGFADDSIGHIILPGNTTPWWPLTEES